MGGIAISKVNAHLRRLFLMSALAFMALLVQPYSAFASHESTYDVELTSCYGETQFDTAVAQSKAAFDSSKWAIVVGEEGWSDALAASGLAGALKCPILYSCIDELPAATTSELERLGVSDVLVLGGTAVVGSDVEAELASSFSVTRLAGVDGYETQMKIFDFGVESNLWSKDLLFVASGRSYYDALSVAPIAYAHRAPIFLVDDSLDFSQNQKEKLLEAAKLGYGKKIIVAGGVKVISEKAEGFMQFV